jgi:PAS domain S-box-containing protein
MPKAIALDAAVPSHEESLVEAILDYAIYMLDMNGCILSWNPGAKRIKGYTPEEILGQSFTRFFTEQDRLDGVPQRIIQQAIEEGRAQSEGWRVRKDGSQFWALAVVDLVRDRDGRPVALAKITRDMTEQHRASVALRESERNFRLLVDGVSDYAIYMLDPTGRIYNWNAGAQRIKGLNAEQAIGSHFSRFYTPEEQALGIPQQSLEKARRQGRYEAEGWRLRANGERFWASVAIETIYDENGEHIGFAKVTRDITERREIQLKLEETRDQLFQSQKLQALGQFTGGVAHDFNNLLTIILGSADLLQRGSSDERQKAHLNNIIQAARRGSEITRQLLAFARQQPLQTTQVDIRALLDNAQPLLEQSLVNGQRLFRRTGLNLHAVDSDPSQLELALLNLVINARDASAEHTSIQIEAENVLLEGEPDGLRGPFVAVSVRDQGSGMSEEVRSRIFDPFFTTKGVGKGTGLGMSQVHGFVKQSGGAVRVESEPNRGTTVTLYLPASQREAPSRASAVTGKRILLVEDDITLASVAIQMMDAMGHQVICVNDANAALQLFYRGESFDLMLSDVVMPGGTNGLELANSIRKLLPELPIILATGYSNVLNAAPLAFPLLRKPFSYEDLEQALAKLLQDPM